VLSCAAEGALAAAGSGCDGRCGVFFEGKFVAAFRAATRALSMSVGDGGGLWAVAGEAPWEVDTIVGLLFAAFPLVKPLLNPSEVEAVGGFIEVELFPAAVVPDWN
jgi:hypothetical protein